MADEESILRDPEFQKSLRRRSRTRWGLTCLLAGAYLGWALVGLYIPDVYGKGFLGSAFPWGIVLGYVIIALSIVLSLVYVWRVNTLTGTGNDRRD